MKINSWDTGSVLLSCLVWTGDMISVFCAVFDSGLQIRRSNKDNLGIIIQISS